MSKSGNANRSLLLEVAKRFAERAVQALQAADLRVEDARALLSLWCMCMYDVLDLSIQDFRAEVCRFADSMRGWSWVEVVKVLKNFDNAFLHLEVPTDSKTSLKRWLAQLCATTTADGGRAHLLFPSALITVVYLGVKDQDPDAVRRVHQFLQFPLRGDIITDERRKVLAEEGIQSFKDCEGRLQQHVLPEDIAWNPFFQNFVSDWDPWDSLLCRISDGSALSGDRSTRRWWEKWACLDLPERSYIEWFAGKVFPASSQKCDESDCSKFFQVPKSSDALRGISIEPAGKAFLQQGLMLSLRRYIRSHKVLRKRFEPLHPEYNAELARIGSISGRYATIDLSEASDSVMLELLERMAAETDFLEAITLARCNKIRLPNGEVMTLKKYAGMGNALTFTIESLVFASLIEQGIRDAGGSIAKSRYRVYGDDIVVEDEYYSSVAAVLTSCGFKVNMSKSFSKASGTPFRESCGGEYFLGSDVKPVRVPRKEFRKIDRHMTAETITGYIDIANSAFGVLPSVRWWIIHHLKESLPQDLLPLFSSDGAIGLRSDQPTNYHLRVEQLGETSRAVRDWHYTKRIRHGQIKAVTERMEVPDEVAYEYKLLQLSARGSHDGPLSIGQQLDRQVAVSAAATTGTAWVVAFTFE